MKEEESKNMGKMASKDGSSEITATAAKFVLHGHGNNDSVKTQPESDYSYKL